jgi:hypothetical protein
MEKILDALNQLKLNQEDTNHLNSSITSNEIEAVIKSLPQQRRDQEQMDSTRPLRKN